MIGGTRTVYSYVVEHRSAPTPNANFTVLRSFDERTTKYLRKLVQPLSKLLRSSTCCIIYLIPFF